MNARRWRASILAAAAVGLTLVAPADAAGCQGVRRTGRWTTIDPPVALPVAVAGVQIGGLAGAPRVAGDPFNAKRMYFSAGRKVYRTTDGGCSWQLVFDLDTAGEPTNLHRSDAAYQIMQLVVSGKAVYAMAYDPLSALTAPLPVYLAMSQDGGSTWQVPAPGAAEGTSGAVPLCSSARMSVAPGDPRTVYLDCSSSSFATFFAAIVVRPGVFVTTDSGRTWRKSAGTGYTAYGIQPGVVVDPLDAKKVWSLYGNELGTPDIFYTTDGAEHWKSVWRGSGIGKHMMAAMTLRPRGKPARVMIATTAGIVESLDGGKHWKVIRSPMPPGQEGPMLWATYEGGGASIFMMAAYNVSYTFTEDVPPSCTQGQRIARYHRGSRTWHALPAPVSTPSSGVLQFRAPAPGKGFYAVLATAYPTKKDCESATNGRSYLMTYSDADSR